MKMSLCGVRPTVLPRVVPQPQRSMAKRQRPSTARPNTSAPEPPLRTQAVGKSQPQPPAPTPARAPWLGNAAMALGIAGSAFALNMSLRGFISDSITVFKSEQAASIIVLQGNLTASSREQAASNRELAASITTLKSEQAASNSVLNTKLDSTNTKLDSNTASIMELKSEVNAKVDSFSATVQAKVDSFSATVQAQQVETAKLQGLVSGLQEGGKKK